MNDAALLWRWANDAETRSNAFSKAPIPYNAHVAWLRERLGSDRTRLLIFADPGGPVGQVRLDMADDVAEVSIVVAPERRGTGHGQRILREALGVLRMEHGPAVRARALVLTHNARSLAMFKACGFVPIGVERRQSQEAIVLERRESEALP